MIPILMDSTKLLSTLVNDNTNGLGTLSECTSCIVKEERNGAFTLELKLPQNAKHFSEVAVGGVIKAKAREAGDPQLFRISKITKPMQGVVTVYANHISYDLNKTSVLPFASAGINDTLRKLKSNMRGGQAFSFTTNISNSSSAFINKEPQSARALFGGQQGSLLDVFGGEFLFDNLTVSLLSHRGTDAGVQLRYGKNITDLTQEENVANTFTAIQPYALDKDENVILGSLLTVVQSAEPKIMNLDLSSHFNDEDETPTVAAINTLAQEYATANHVGVPKVSINVSFIGLWQTEEYKNIAPLERVSLCDTVTVVFEKLGVNAKAKVISTTYDTLRERYTEIEIGDAKSTLASTIKGVNQGVQSAVSSATGFLDKTIQQITTLVANGLGLFVTREQVGETGGYKYYLHNKPTLTASQYQWTFNSNGFAVSRDYGATWSAGIDANGNAVFNSLAANIIKAMSISGTEITGGTIKGASIEAGGQNNANGTIIVRNASGQQIGKWDKDGINVSSGSITGGTITGVTINSGEMYWYKGTIHEASMKAGTFSILDHGVETRYDQAIVLTSDAILMSYDKAVKIGPINDGSSARGTIILDDESAVLSVKGDGGYVEARSDGVKLKLPDYGTTRLKTHSLCWRGIIDGNGKAVWVVAMK